jgi:hypothetical protein
MKALMWAYSWAAVRESTGREPTVDEVADWWNESRRTAFREQAAFRDCFPTLDTPAPLFASPEAQASLTESVKAGEALVAAVRDRKRPNDMSILQIAMTPANL